MLDTTVTLPVQATRQCAELRKGAMLTTLGPVCIQPETLLCLMQTTNNQLTTPANSRRSYKPRDLNTACYEHRLPGPLQYHPLSPTRRRIGPHAHALTTCRSLTSSMQCCRPCKPDAAITPPLHEARPSSALKERIHGLPTRHALPDSTAFSGPRHGARVGTASILPHKLPFGTAWWPHPHRGRPVWRTSRQAEMKTRTSNEVLFRSTQWYDCTLSQGSLSSQGSPPQNRPAVLAQALSVNRRSK